ncbi:hypothetical protein I7I48_03611 [Histoplasma ohiense]|nr:hypothetical protein I7I48_03611 [Histoplasma ohiense (nom. inval.)]
MISCVLHVQHFLFGHLEKFRVIGLWRTQALDFVPSAGTNVVEQNGFGERLAKKITWKSPPYQTSSSGSHRTREEQPRGEFRSCLCLREKGPRGIYKRALLHAIRPFFFLPSSASIFILRFEYIQNYHTLFNSFIYNS